MESLFTRMLKGEEPCVRIAENADHAAILEPCPVSEGHVVVFPKRPADALFGLAPEAFTDFMLYSRLIAHALETAVPCIKIAAVVYGLKVRHAHLHLIPVRGTPGEIVLDKPRPPADPDQLERLAAKIRSCL